MEGQSYKKYNGPNCALHTINKKQNNIKTELIVIIVLTDRQTKKDRRTRKTNDQLKWTL